MPDAQHVPLVLVPPDARSLAAALGEAHRRYTLHVNRREGWHGYLWQGRFASCALDEAHLLAAMRYAELNPARARLAARADNWPCSSARARLTGADDGLTGRPLGSSEFVAGLETRLGRRLRPGRPGPRKGSVPGEG